MTAPSNENTLNYEVTANPVSRYDKLSIRLAYIVKNVVDKLD